MGMTGSDYERLQESLREAGYLWHRTSLPSLQRILQDSALVPNGGQFDVTYPQSLNSFARMLPAVALFDFETLDKATIADREFAWAGVLVGNLPGVLIRIDRAVLDSERLLLPSHITEGDRRLDSLANKEELMVIPDVEALHLGPISLDAFREFTLLDHPDSGGFRFRHFDVRDCGSLFELAKAWQSENDGHAARRHAAGRYTLEEAQNGKTPAGWDLSQLYKSS
jgi:hypothetical protein